MLRHQHHRTEIAAALTALAVLVGLAACDERDRATDTAGGDVVASADVRVRDGDTIVVGATPVRLKGLHCPERNAEGGAEATEATRALVAGQSVACALTGERSYDRHIGTCTVADADLGRSLVDRGVCTRCARYDPEERYTGGPDWTLPVPAYCRG